MRIIVIVILLLLYSCIVYAQTFKFGENYDYKYILIQTGVPEDKVNACMEWALGENYGILDIHSIDDQLLRRHPKIFNDTETLYYVSDAYKMIGEKCIKYLLKEDGK